MFVLHIDLKMKPERTAALVGSFHRSFLPAISAQAGFGAAHLLRSTDDANRYCLVLQFDSQPSQQKWVATDLHQQVWPTIESQCSDYSVASYTSV